MAQTRAVPRRRPANINFNQRRVAAAKEIARHRRIENINIKILLPQGKNVEVRHRGNAVRRIKFEDVQYSLEKLKTSDMDIKTN